MDAASNFHKKGHRHPKAVKYWPSTIDTNDTFKVLKSNCILHGLRTLHYSTNKTDWFPFYWNTSGCILSLYSPKVSSALWVFLRLFLGLTLNNTLRIYYTTIKPFILQWNYVRNMELNVVIEKLPYKFTQ